MWNWQRQGGPGPRPRWGDGHLSPAPSPLTRPPLPPSPFPPGDDPLSRFVNLLIASPLYSLMKVAAKGVLKGSAERAGVAWDGTARALAATDELYEIKAELEDPAITYPAYYTQPFHAYDEGNLAWEPAREVEAATAAMGLRTFKDDAPALTPLAAQAKLRAGIQDAIAAFVDETGARPVVDILDVGCSAGVSSRALADAYPAATVTGLDLSPFFLAVAELRERQLERGQPDVGPLAVRGAIPRRPRVRYVHANAEAVPAPPSTYDLVASVFVMHELRPAAIDGVVAEAARVLRPGGVLALADNDPRSATIQNLPPALFTLMKSTEPWSDEYYCHDVEASLRGAGFEEVRTVAADHRHRVVLGRKKGGD